MAMARRSLSRSPALVRRRQPGPGSDAGGSRPAWRWAVGGVLAGLALALLVNLPASWLAALVADATGQRLVLADTRGTLWSGSAVVVLTGGSGSRDASALPGRLRWTFGLARENRARVEVRLRHACCIADQIRLRLEPGFGRLRVALPPGRQLLGHWPASWLAGLGTPFNTLALGGAVQLVADGLTIDSVQGRWQVSGSAELALLGLSSRLVPLPALGSYRVTVGGGPDGATLSLATLHGPLSLRGSGQWVGQRLRFLGEAQAEPGSEPVLNNLLNLLGQRRGALAVLRIG